MNKKDRRSVFMWFFKWLIITEAITYFAIFIIFTIDKNMITIVYAGNAFVRALPFMFCVMLGFIAGFLTRGEEKKSIEFAIQEMDTYQKWIHIAMFRNSLPPEAEKSMMLSEGTGSIPDRFIPGGKK